MKLQLNLHADGLYIGRVYNPSDKGPCVVAIKNNQVYDLTCFDIPTVSVLLENPNVANRVLELISQSSPFADLNSCDYNGCFEGGTQLLSPVDLQAVKACGVTFAHSMLERIIEEKAGGDNNKADEIRTIVTDIVGDSLKDIVPASPDAIKLKSALIQQGIWSQYLEVGIGPYAEVFTKAQPLSSVGTQSEIGIHPESEWNNPEPEIVLIVDSKGNTKGATLGNDVNLRDFEGRSALLLGKAKDNNGSCSIGPFIRLFDETFSIDDVRKSKVNLLVKGEDGFEMHGTSSMEEISRDPLDLVKQTINENHQYPDGLALFLGTLFAPTQDRDQPGSGFTHKLNDQVIISSDELGCLTNTVNHSDKCTPWKFGISKLMSNLAMRGLIGEKK